MVIEAGSRPAAAAAARTAPNVQRAMSGSAVCRMNPSACSPTSRSAFGPYAAIQIGKAPSRTQGIRSGWPWWVTSRPSASPLITVIASDRVTSETGGCPMYRRAESPRPMPQIVRLPNSSFSVANMDAITDQSRVPGLVTIGPTIIDEVSARILGKSTNVSCQSTCESNVHPYPNPAASASFIIATTPLAGGLGCSTTPNSIKPPISPSRLTLRRGAPRRRKNPGRCRWNHGPFRRDID